MVMDRIRGLIDGGTPLSPKAFQDRLEKKATKLETSASWLEKEAATRKRMAKARMRIKRAEDAMGRGYGKVIKLSIVVVIVTLILVLIVRGC